MISVLHEERLNAVIHHLLDSGATRILDLGCGQGELLRRLIKQPRFTHIMGIDINERALDEARLRLGLDFPDPADRVQVRYGSFDETNEELIGFDAAVMVETIEHIDPSRLSQVERAVFGAMRTPTVLITTPNQEYNILHGIAPGKRRHTGHRFEWSRAKFRQWAQGVAGRNGYCVNFIDIGPHDPLHGSSTQMARFVTPP